MAKLRMQKIEMIALLEDSQKIVERLQRRGVMELIRSDDEDIVSLNTNSSVAQFERNILTANSALEYLQKYCGTKAVSKSETAFSILVKREGRCIVEAIEDETSLYSTAFGC